MSKPLKKKKKSSSTKAKPKVTCFAINEDGRTLAVAVTFPDRRTQNMQVWNIEGENPELLCELTDIDADVEECYFQGTYNVLWYDKSNRVCQWNYDDDSPASSMAITQPVEGKITCISNRDVQGLIAVGTSSGLVYLFNNKGVPRGAPIDTGSYDNNGEKRSSSVEAVQLVNAKAIVSTADQSTRVYTITTGSSISKINGINIACFDGAGQRALGLRSVDEKTDHAEVISVNLLGKGEGKRVSSPKFDGKVTCSRFSPDGRLLCITTTTGRAYLYNSNDEKLRFETEKIVDTNERNFVRCACVSDTGKVVSLLKSGQLMIHDTRNAGSEIVLLGLKPGAKATTTETVKTGTWHNFFILGQDLRDEYEVSAEGSDEEEEEERQMPERKVIMDRPELDEGDETEDDAFFQTKKEPLKKKKKKKRTPLTAIVEDRVPLPALLAQRVPSPAQSLPPPRAPSPARLAPPPREPSPVEFSTFIAGGNQMSDIKMPDIIEREIPASPYREPPPTVYRKPVQPVPVFEMDTPDIDMDEMKLPQAAMPAVTSSANGRAASSVSITQSPSSILQRNREVIEGRPPRSPFKWFKFQSGGDTLLVAKDNELRVIAPVKSNSYPLAESTDCNVTTYKNLPGIVAQAYTFKYVSDAVLTFVCKDGSLYIYDIENGDYALKSKDTGLYISCIADPYWFLDYPDGYIPYASREGKVFIDYLSSDGYDTYTGDIHAPIDAIAHWRLDNTTTFIVGSDNQLHGVTPGNSEINFSNVIDAEQGQFLCFSIEGDRAVYWKDGQITIFDIAAIKTDNELSQPDPVNSSLEPPHTTRFSCEKTPRHAEFFNDGKQTLCLVLSDGHLAFFGEMKDKTRQLVTDNKAPAIKDDCLIAVTYLREIYYVAAIAPDGFIYTYKVVIDKQEPPEDAEDQEDQEIDEASLPYVLDIDYGQESDDEGETPESATAIELTALGKRNTVIDWTDVKEIEPDENEAQDDVPMLPVQAKSVVPSSPAKLRSPAPSPAKSEFVRVSYDSSESSERQEHVRLGNGLSDEDNPVYAPSYTIKLPDDVNASDVIYSPDGRFLVIGRQAFDLSVCDTSTRKFLGEFVDTSKDINRMEFLPDGNLLCVGYHGSVASCSFPYDELVSFASNRPLEPEKCPKGSILETGEFRDQKSRTGLALSPDNIFATTGHRTVLYGVDDFKAIHLLEDTITGNWTDPKCTAVHFSPQGHIFVAGYEDSSLCAWKMPSSGTQTTTPELLFHRKLKRKVVTSVRVSSDGKIAVAFETGVIGLYDTSGKELYTRDFKCTRSVIRFLPDEKHFIVAGTTGLIQAFNTDSGNRVATFEQQTGDDVRDISISPDGTQLVAVSNNYPLAAWDLTSTTFYNGSTVPQSVRKRRLSPVVPPVIPQRIASPATTGAQKRRLSPVISSSSIPQRLASPSIPQRKPRLEDPVAQLGDRYNDMEISNEEVKVPMEVEDAEEYELPVVAPSSSLSSSDSDPELFMRFNLSGDRLIVAHKRDLFLLARAEGIKSWNVYASISNLPHRIVSCYFFNSDSFGKRADDVVCLFSDGLIALVDVSAGIIRYKTKSTKSLDKDLIDNEDDSFVFTITADNKLRTRMSVEMDTQAFESVPATKEVEMAHRVKVGTKMSDLLVLTSDGAVYKLANGQYGKKPVFTGHGVVLCLSRDGKYVVTWISEDRSRQLGRLAVFRVSSGEQLTSSEQIKLPMEVVMSPTGDTVYYIGDGARDVHYFEANPDDKSTNQSPVDVMYDDKVEIRDVIGLTITTNMVLATASLTKHDQVELRIGRPAARPPNRKKLPGSYGVKMYNSCVKVDCFHVINKSRKWSEVLKNTDMQQKAVPVQSSSIQPASVQPAPVTYPWMNARRPPPPPSPPQPIFEVGATFEHKYSLLDDALFVSPSIIVSCGDSKVTLHIAGSGEVVVADNIPCNRLCLVPSQYCIIAYGSRNGYIYLLRYNIDSAAVPTLNLRASFSPSIGAITSLCASTARDPAEREGESLYMAVAGVSFTGLYFISYSNGDKTWSNNMKVSTNSPVVSIDVSRDEKKFISAAGEDVDLWDATSAKRLGGFSSDDLITSVRFSRDAGHVILCDAHGVMHIWNQDKDEDDGEDSDSDDEKNEGGWDSRHAYDGFGYVAETWVNPFGNKIYFRVDKSPSIGILDAKTWKNNPIASRYPSGIRRLAFNRTGGRCLVLTGDNRAYVIEDDTPMGRTFKFTLPSR